VVWLVGRTTTVLLCWDRGLMLAKGVSLQGVTVAECCVLKNEINRINKIKVHVIYVIIK
jgi:hypothetical protein